MAASPVDLGEIVDFRRGDRTWRLTVPKDGHLPEGGLLPAFIEWSPGPHPSIGQQDLGVRLGGISLTTPEPKRLGNMFATLKIDHLATISEGEPGLKFSVETPLGNVTLD